jgi:hypothetical protein
MDMIIYREENDIDICPEYNKFSKCQNLLTSIGLGIMEVIIRFRVHLNLSNKLRKILGKIFQDYQKIGQPTGKLEKMNYIKNLYEKVTSGISKTEAFKLFREKMRSENKILSESLECLIGHILDSPKNNSTKEKTKLKLKVISEALDIYIEYKNKLYPFIKHNQGIVIRIYCYKKEYYLMYHKDEVEIDYCLDNDINLAREPFYYCPRSAIYDGLKIPNFVPKKNYEEHKSIPISSNELVYNEEGKIEAEVTGESPNKSVYTQNQYEDKIDQEILDEFLTQNKLQNIDEIKRCSICKKKLSAKKFPIKCGSENCSICAFCRTQDKNKCNKCSRSYTADEKAAIQILFIIIN